MRDLYTLERYEYEWKRKRGRMRTIPVEQRVEYMIQWVDHWATTPLAARAKQDAIHYLAELKAELLRMRFEEKPAPKKQKAGSGGAKSAVRVGHQ